MKHLFTLLFVGLIALASCSSSESCKNHEHVQTKVCKIEGMTCGGCEKTVTMKLSEIEGLEVVSVNHETAQAVCKYNPEDVSEEQIKEVLGKDYTLVSIEDKTDSK